MSEQAVIYPKVARDSENPTAPLRCPWRTTEVGGCFIVPVFNDEDLEIIRRRLSVAAVHEKKNGHGAWRMRTFRDQRIIILQRVS